MPASNLVEQLRYLKVLPVISTVPNDTARTPQVCLDAADEIERLRSEVDGYASAFETQDEEIERLLAELRGWEKATA